jgi:hypothetical protein
VVAVIGVMGEVVSVKEDWGTSGANYAMFDAASLNDAVEELLGMT